MIFSPFFQRCVWSHCLLQHPWVIATVRLVPPHPYLHFHPVALKHRAPLGKGLLWHSSIRLKRKKLPCYCLSSMWHHNSTPYIFPKAQNTLTKLCTILHSFPFKCVICLAATLLAQKKPHSSLIHYFPKTWSNFQRAFIPYPDPNNGRTQETLKIETVVVSNINWGHFCPWKDVP